METYREEWLPVYACPRYGAVRDEIWAPASNSGEAALVQGLGSSWPPPERRRNRTRLGTQGTHAGESAGQQRWIPNTRGLGNGGVNLFRETRLAREGSRRRNGSRGFPFILRSPGSGRGEEVAHESGNGGGIRASRCEGEGSADARGPTCQWRREREGVSQRSHA
jgi:hypothetical protein